MTMTEAFEKITAGQKAETAPAFVWHENMVVTPQSAVAVYADGGNLVVRQAGKGGDSLISLSSRAACEALVSAIQRHMVNIR